MNTELSERIKKLPPEKLDLLLKQLKPGAKLKQPAAPAKPSKRPFREDRDQNFYLTVAQPGVLDSLQFVTRPREELKPDYMEVEIHASCMNFRDVAVALGMYPMPPCGTMPEFGCDGAGKVVAVGSAVTRFKPGDDVFFLCSDSTFSRYARVREMGAFKKPAHWSYEEASALALIFITVIYSLRVPGRLSEGERILIHSAAGGIGLAAIQTARKIGAEIYATAGTEEKREYLRSIGIEHVMDSRSTTFVEEMMDITKGEGIDLILNSLAGDAIDRGMTLLRPDGRFIELGKRDLVPGRMLDLGPFTRTLAFASVDTSYSFTLWPKRLFSTMDEIREDVENGRIQPLPTRIYKSSELIDAFRYMTTGKHIGRIAISMRGEPIMVAA
jgi:NADPH:quinone reductase-like Zn-dependent oxidoreductase